MCTCIHTRTHTHACTDGKYRAPLRIHPRHQGPPPAVPLGHGHAASVFGEERRPGSLPEEGPGRRGENLLAGVRDECECLFVCLCLCVCVALVCVFVCLRLKTG